MKIDHFFKEKAKNNTKSDIGIHNLSTHTLISQELQLLRKGLSFAVTLINPPQELHLHLLQQFDNFSRSLRLATAKNNLHTHHNRHN